jgi:hypothetical protein
MADALPIEFLADVAVELDPRRASEVISRIPPDRIAAVTAELVRRHEYVTMGCFVGHLADPALRAALGEMSDADLSHGRRRELAQSVGRRKDDVLEAIVAAAAEHGMWPELLPLILELPADAQERVSRAAAKLDHRYRRLTISSASLAAAASPNDRYSDGSDSSSSISLGSPAPSAIRSTRA